MKNAFFLLFVSVLIFASCEADQNTSSAVRNAQDIKNGGNVANSDLIDNPVSMNPSVNPDELAQIQFDGEVFDFGTIQEGESVEHKFKFTNTGENPLIISAAKGSCGCTVPQWPREPIEPGASDEIVVRFNSKGKSGNQEKTVTLTANTNPSTKVLRIKANVAK